MAPRDQWIGWNQEQKAQNLQLVVNNGRYLILPWVHVRGLASKILGQCARQLPGDWELRYGYRPLLLETLVDARRFRGTCYRAANWILVGQTQGRGRMDSEHRSYVLVRRYEARYCGSLAFVIDSELHRRRDNQQPLSRSV